MSNDQTELASKAPAEDVKRVVTEFTRLTNLSSDYSGQGGQYLRTQCERLGLSPKTIRKLRTMERQDEAKRQSEIRETIHGWICMGYLDQVDAFDDIRTDLARVLNSGGADASEEEESFEAQPEAEATPEPKPRRSRRKDAALDSLTTTH